MNKSSPTNESDSDAAPIVYAVLHERLDTAIARPLEVELRGRLVGDAVVLDLGCVRFADSSGLAVLVRCHAQYPGLSMMNVHPSLERCFSRMPTAVFPPVVGLSTASQDAEPAIVAYHKAS